VSVRKGLLITIFTLVFPFLFASDVDTYNIVWDKITEKKYDDAIMLLEKNIPQERRKYYFYYLRGHSLFCQNAFSNRREALGDFYKANEFNSKIAINLYMIGLCEDLINNKETALTYYNKSAEFYDKTNGDENPYTVIADIYYDRNELGLALENLVKAELEEPDNSYIFMLRSLVYTKQGKKETSEEQYQKAMLLGNNPEYPLYRAQCFLEIGDYESAKILITEGIANHVQEAECIASLGYIAYMLGDDTKANELMMDAFKMNVRDTMVLQYLTYLYYVKRDIANAATVFSMYMVFADDLEKYSVKDAFTEIENRFSKDITFIKFINRRITKHNKIM